MPNLNTHLQKATAPGKPRLLSHTDQTRPRASRLGCGDVCYSWIVKVPLYEKLSR